MPQIRTIKGKQGTKYKAVVRRTGYKDEYQTFPTKTEAQEWASDLEHDIRDRKVDPHRLAQRKRLMDAVDIYLPKIADTKNYKDSLRLCSWWKNKLGTSPLSDLTAISIDQCPDSLRLFRLHEESLSGRSQWLSKHG